MVKWRGGINEVHLTRGCISTMLLAVGNERVELSPAGDGRTGPLVCPGGGGQGQVRAAQATVVQAVHES